MVTLRFFILLATTALMKQALAQDGIICGDDVQFSIESTMVEWSEFKFPDDDATGANVYISDELSLRNNQGWWDGEASDGVDMNTFSSVESMDCYLSTDASSVYSSTNIGLEDCKPEISVNDTHIMYMYEVWHDPRDLTKQINRDEPASVCYTCVMIRDAEINSDVILPQMSIDHYDTLGVSGTFTVTLHLEQPKGTPLSESSSVNVNTNVWVKAEMTGVDSTDDDLVITITDCWASPNTWYYRQYQFIKDDCPVDDGVGVNTADDEYGYTKIVENAAGLDATVKFRTFVWNRISGQIVAPDSDLQQIYVTCRISICSETYMQSSDMTCINGASCENHSRKRREVGGKFRRAISSMAGEKPSVTLTAHPVHVQTNY